MGNVESHLSALCHKTELNTKTGQKFKLPSPPPTPEKQCICFASASRRRDKNQLTKLTSTKISKYVCPAYFVFKIQRLEGKLIDLFHILFAHACIGHVTRYFSIIGETLHRWGKQILSH